MVYNEKSHESSKKQKEDPICLGVCLHFNA